MDLSTLRLIYRYDRWVNDRLLADAKRLSPEQTTHRYGASFDTIHGTLAHMLAAQIAWLSRWNGTSPNTLLSGDAFASLAAIETRWQEHNQQLDRFLDALTPERLTAPLSYIDSKGNPYTLPLWQQMLHVVNHGTHHRSELADMLTREGYPPEPTDLIVYCLRSSGQ